MNSIRKRMIETRLRGLILKEKQAKEQAEAAKGKTAVIYTRVDAMHVRRRRLA